MSSRFLFPAISIGPNRGMTLLQRLNTDAIAERIGNADAVIEIQRQLVFQGAVIDADRKVARLSHGRWDDVASFRYETIGDERFDWRIPGNLSYLETNVSVLEGAAFSSPALPNGTYTIYCAPGQKNILGDYTPKYGDRNVIAMFARFQAFLVCYPACRIELDLDIAESVLFFNPFSSPVAAHVELEGVAKGRNIAIPPLSGFRLDLREMLPPGKRSWWGSVLVGSKARPVLFFSKHSAADPNLVTTIEHSLAYYADDVRVPLTRHLRRRIGRHIAQSKAASAANKIMPE